MTRLVSEGLLIVQSMRPRQWTKNLIVVAPPLFAGILFEPGVLARASAMFAVLSALSGAVYILNDLHDVEFDRAYSKTAGRPIASGALNPRVALGAAGLVAIMSVTGSALLAPVLPLVLIGYVALQVAYTYALKRVPLVDIAAIAAGFVLRAVAGAEAVDVPHSPWLLACTALLVMFLAAGERRAELAEMGERAALHRPALAHYSLRSLDAVIAATLGATSITYVLYVLIAPGAQAHPRMVLTVPFVLYGLVRYVFLLHGQAPKESAEDLLLTDRPILLDVLLWFVAVVIVIHGT